MPKLSVLIPVYNGEKYIKRCLENLLNQNIPKSDYEILIINDGSKDNSASILQYYASKHSNILFFNEENRGSDISRNKLIEKATGDYIYFLDIDDYVIPNSLSTILELAISYNLDICGFQSKTIDQNIKSENVDVELNQLRSINSLNVTTGEEFILSNHFIQTIWWFFIKKDFIDKYNIKFVESNGQSSYDSVYATKSLVLADRFAYVKVPIHRYLLSDNSVMRASNLEDQTKLYNNLVAAVIEFNSLISELNSIKTLDPSMNNYLIDLRGKMTRDIINRMLKSKISNSFFKEKLRVLKVEKLYPIDILPANYSLKSKIYLSFEKNMKLLFLTKRIYSLRS
ncbi:glycosyltransferase [Pseudotamlana agarivorans]|uniref:glycosyltransferase n=1 Tax=Pseudotamlana agarivorans TaxID=481183 RepID=UPI00082F741B|nr:glycosyltransferase [Tamlana agarivorans]